MESRFLAGAFSGKTLFSSVVFVVTATRDELWGLSLPRAGFVVLIGTMLLLRLAVELARLSSSLTDDLAMLCLPVLSELLTTSSVVLDFIDNGIGLFFLGFLVAVDDDDDAVFGWFELLSLLRFEDFAVSPIRELRLVEFLTEELSVLLLFCSFSELSHGLPAIHLSSQLQPQVGLLGSINIGFAVFELLFKCCCKYKLES